MRHPVSRAMSCVHSDMHALHTSKHNMQKHEGGAGIKRTKMVRVVNEEYEALRTSTTLLGSTCTSLLELLVYPSGGGTSEAWVSLYSCFVRICDDGNIGYGHAGQRAASR